jgi:hypothetical protein
MLDETYNKPQTRSACLLKNIFENEEYFSGWAKMGSYVLGCKYK